MKKILFVFFMGFQLFGANLEDIINVSQNAKIAQLKELEAKINTLNLNIAQRSYLPSLNLSGAYKLTDGEKSIITPDRSLSAIVSIDFLLYDGGAREATLSALKNLEESANIRSNNEKNKLAFLSSNLYFNLKAVKNIINAKKSEIDYLSSLKEKISKMYKAGLVTIDEYESIVAQEQLSRSEYIDLEQKQNEILGSIELLTGVKFSDIDFNSSLMMPDFSALSSNYEIKAIEQEYQASLESVKQSNANYLPKIFIKNDYVFYKNKYNNDPFSSIFNIPSSQNPFSNLINKSEIIRKKGSYNEFMLGFKWNIFNFGATKKETQKAKVASDKVRMGLEHKRLENKIRLNDLKNSILSLESKISAQKLRLKSAKSALQTAQKRYESGLISYSDLLLLIARKFEADSALEISCDELEIKKANYFYESGNLILQKVIK